MHWTTFLHYLAQKSPWQAVFPPLALSLYILLFVKNRVPHLAKWWVGLTALSCFTVRWAISEDTVSLYILPLFLFYVAWSSYRGQDWSPGHAYAGTYFSLLVVDLLSAYRLKNPHVSVLDFYWGVGGAGWGDGLFLFPISSALLVLYVQWRRRPPQGLSPTALISQGSA
jgi:hypothetical protein